MNKADKSDSGIPQWPRWPLERVLAFAMMAAGLMVAAYIWRFFSYPISSNVEKWGQTGDYFGGLLNPIISACTLVVAVAVWRLQKTELAATKDELRIQRGQQRFFDLMNIYHQTVDSISVSVVRQIRRMAPGAMRKAVEGSISPYDMYEDLGSESIQVKGKAAIRHKIDELESTGDDDLDIKWLEQMSKATGSGEPAASEALAALKAEWESQQANLLLAHYFRVVTLLLSEAESLLGKDEHHRYVALFVAQLASDELVALGYYMWLDPNGEELLPPARTYGLLQNTKKRKQHFGAVLPPEVFTRPTH